MLNSLREWASAVPLGFFMKNREKWQKKLPVLQNRELFNFADRYCSSPPGGVNM